MKKETRKWLSDYFGVSKPYIINPDAPISNFMSDINRLGDLVEDFAKFKLEQKAKRLKNGK